jgi:hypothetical protein
MAKYEPTLEKFEVPRHDEVDVYGLDQQFVYTSGTLDDLDNYFSAIVEFRSGGSLHRDGLVTFWATTSFPPTKEANVEGSMVLPGVTVESEELILFADAIVGVLARRAEEEALLKADGR